MGLQTSLRRPPINQAGRTALDSNNSAQILKAVDKELGHTPLASVGADDEQAAAAKTPPRPQPAVLVIT